MMLIFKKKKLTSVEYWKLSMFCIPSYGRQVDVDCFQNSLGFHAMERSDSSFCMLSIEFVRIAEPRPHEDVREIPTTPEPDANVLALLKELTVRISELPTEVKDVTISEVKNLLSELEEATGEKICPKESASRKKLKQKDWLGVKKINMKKPRADFPHKSNELNIRNYRQENTSEL